MGIAYAHGVGEPLRDGALAIRWAYDPLLLVFIGTLGLYGRGLRKVGARRPVRPWQTWLYLSGMAVLIATLVPPVDTWADELFSLHMVQHLLITIVGMPLVIFGAPYVVILRGLPVLVRRRLLLPLVRSRLVHRACGVIQRPVVALLLYEIAMWGWHIPWFYDAALANSAVHLLEHGCMALTALNLWRLIIDPYPLRSSLGLPGRIALLGAMTILDVLLSAALTFSAASWYAYNSVPVPPWWPLGRLEDQRLGGLLMWVPGGLIELTALAVTFGLWARQELRSSTDPAAISRSAAE